MKTRLALFFIAIVIAAHMFCKRQDGLSKIHAGDFSIVYRGKYHGRLRFLGEGREYRELVEGLRAYVEKNMSVLSSISERFYTIPHKDYRFKFAALDETSDYLVLRYFARIDEHPLYAGYQIQFVFALPSRSLMKVFTSEVPLE